MKLYVPFTVIFIASCLFIASWLGYIGYLAKKGSRACPESPFVNRRNDPSPISLELQDVINNYSSQKGGIGLQVTILFSDGASWNGEAGYADIGKRCPITRNHHLYLGSMTKLFTAALVMEQVEKGTLALDDTIDHWVQMPTANGITIRNLLNHTSGLPDYARDAGFQIRWFGFPRKTWRTDELSQVIHDKPTRFMPGSRYEYSNSNYLLLGIILEKVTGKSYSEMLDETFRAKLGLSDTYFLTYHGDLVIANGYDEALLHLGRRNLTGFRRSLESGAYTAGGILSTAENVARFVHALFNQQVISGASLAEMKTFIDGQDEDMPELIGYGLGIRQLVIDGEPLIGHTGSIPGYSGIVLHHEQKGYTIVILSNLSTIEQTRLLAKVQRIVIQRDR